FGRIERATTNLAEAVDGADVIAIATVHNDHEAVAAALAPLLRDGQIVCLVPGYVGGALHFRHQLALRGATAGGQLGEIDNFPFTGAIRGPASVHVASVKRQVQLAALPAADGPDVLTVVQALLPSATLAASVFHTALGTMNPILHVPGMLANQ